MLTARHVANWVLGSIKTDQSRGHGGHAELVGSIRGSDVVTQHSSPAPRRRGGCCVIVFLPVETRADCASSLSLAPPVFAAATHPVIRPFAESPEPESSRCKLSKSVWGVEYFS